MSEMSGEETAARPLSRMRRAIAERLTLSATTVPHFSVTISADVTALQQLRGRLKLGGVALSVNDFVLCATARTLTEFPDVNARTDGRDVWMRPNVNLGIAVDVPGGLLVPVIPNADHCSLRELADRVKSLAKAARERTLPVKALAGGTFTVSNLGMFDVDEFRAIVNPGESGILAVASVKPTAVPLGETFVTRQLIKLTLSADHRLVDGALAARFLGALRTRLQQPEPWCTATLDTVPTK
jgi:pyruvate dehydrogenase E2 component (dihydrolipoamide acetyltransferase)